MAMIFHGQHEGVAQQVRDGSVSYVMLQIGLNDLNHEDFGLEIYQGVISGEPLQLLLDDMVKNITTAVDEISSAGECQIIVTGMQDYITYRMLPEFELLSDPEGQARVIAAIEYVNDGLRELGEERDNVHYFDFNPVFLEEISERLVEDDGRVLIVGDQRIDLEAKGNAPHFAFLDDDSGHPGTVLSGIFANLYIDKMNEAFDMDLQPLSDEELLEIAGIR